MSEAEAEHSPDSPDVDARRGERARLILLLSLFAVLGLRAGWAVLAVIGAVVLMVFFHELGHYLTAKWSGMKVTEFFIGFGPRLWSFRRGETEYGLKLIPAGAYVRIVGMSNLEEIDPADEPRSYRAQSFPKRLMVVCAGSAMHMILAFVMLALAFNLDVPGGTAFNPDELTERWEIGRVVQPGDHSEPTPAFDAGLEEGDKVLAVDGTPVGTYPELVSQIRERGPGESALFTVLRDGEVFDRRVVLAQHPAFPDQEVAYLGVVRGYSPVNRPPVEAVGHAGKELGLGLKEAVLALGRIFSPDGLSNYAENVREGSEPTTTVSPTPRPERENDDDDNRLLSIYGAVRLGAQITETGLVGFLLFVAQINLFIGLVNMAPLLPFDGGHAAVAIYERIRSRGGRRYRVDMAKLMPLTYAVVVALVLLGITSLYLDVVRPVG